MDLDGDEVAEVVARSEAGPGIVLEEISAWDGEAYVLERTRYAAAPAYQGTLPDETPEAALVAYYLSLGRHDLSAAFSLQTLPLQIRQSREALAQSVAAVAEVELGELARDGTPAGTSPVALSGELHLSRYEAGRRIVDSYEGRWSMEETAAGWRVDSITLVKQ